MKPIELSPEEQKSALARAKTLIERMWGYREIEESLTKKRPAYQFDDKLVTLAEKVGDSIRKREKEDLETRLLYK